MKSACVPSNVYQIFEIRSKHKFLKSRFYFGGQVPDTILSMQVWLLCPNSWSRLKSGSNFRPEAANQSPTLDGELHFHSSGVYSLTFVDYWRRELQATFTLRCGSLDFVRLKSSLLNELSWHCNRPNASKDAEEGGVSSQQWCKRMRAWCTF